ncbi:MAG: hypothetical protein Q8S84_03540 [bacterium]|nr:hypothetical protein [bacterium]
MISLSVGLNHFSSNISFINSSTVSLILVIILIQQFISHLFIGHTNFTFIGNSLSSIL